MVSTFASWLHLVRTLIARSHAIICLCLPQVIVNRQVFNESPEALPLQPGSLAKGTQTPVPSSEKCA